MSATATDAKVDPVSEIEELRKLGASVKEAVEHLKSNAAALQKPLDLAHVGNDGASLAYWDKADEQIDIAPAMGASGVLKSIQRELPKEYRKKMKENGRWKSCGEFLRDGYMAKKNHRQGEWSQRHADALEPITKTIQGMSTQVAQDGGALVLPEFNTNIMERVYDNPIWSSTDQYTVVGNNMTFRASNETSRATGSRAGGLQAYWTDEGGSVTDSSPTFRKFMLTLKKLMIVVYLTDELISDAGTSLEQYVSRKVAEEFNWMLGNACFRGTGTGQPLGIYNAPNLLSITKETGQPAATLVTENIDKMWARRVVGGNYAWYHNQDCGPQLDRLAQDVGTGGVTLYRQNNSLAGSAPQTLKNAPRVEVEFASTLGTVGDICLADLGQYVTISKGGIAQAVSVHVEFLTDQTALRFTMRVDGQPWEHSAITPANGSNTQSPFLVVATRA